jgi:F-type H+-transporting ATPase subunit c
MNKILIALIAFLTAGVAFGNEGSTLIQMNEYTKAPLYFLAVALAAFGGTRSQSAAVSVALEGIGRNPSAADKFLVPMILGLALMESLVIFTLITIFLV